MSSSIRLLAASLVLLAAPAASADEGIDSTHKWATSEVCLQVEVGGEFKVKKMVKQWNRAAGPDFVVQADCFGAGVVVKTSRASSEYSGWTYLWWDDAGFITHGEITLYTKVLNRAPKNLRPCFRKRVVAHELGHALGLRHYVNGHAGDAMSYIGKNCGKVRPGDKAELAALYQS